MVPTLRVCAVQAQQGVAANMPQPRALRPRDALTSLHCAWTRVCMCTCVCIRTWLRVWRCTWMQCLRRAAQALDLLRPFQSARRLCDQMHQPAGCRLHHVPSLAPEQLLCAAPSGGADGMLTDDLAFEQGPLGE
jgi:hypothetical protein